MMTEKLELVEGDTLPILTGTVTDDDGNPVDISGWTINLHVGYGTPLVKAAQIPVGTDGFYQFVWEEGDLVEGEWEIEVEFQTDLGVQTFQKTQFDDPLMLKIGHQIA
jgi:hypothetical protein